MRTSAMLRGTSPLCSRIILDGNVPKGVLLSLFIGKCIALFETNPMHIEAPCSHLHQSDLLLHSLRLGKVQLFKNLGILPVRFGSFLIVRNV